MRWARTHNLSVNGRSEIIIYKPLVIMLPGSSRVCVYSTVTARYLVPCPNACRQRHLRKSRLFGEIHQLRGVSTHAPVPQLASEKVACTLDCVDLNRDPCWLEANKCGECFQGFVGKAGHVNSPCGKVHTLVISRTSRKCTMYAFHHRFRTTWSSTP